MRRLAHLFIVLSFLVSTSLVGQTKKIAQPELESGTIEEQFDYIITKSSKFKEFQLIRKTSILKVKAHALDSIKKNREDFIKANKSVEQIEGTISKLETEVLDLKNEIESISVAIDSISFFGTPLSKSAYNTLVWSIIGVLLLILIVLLLRFKSNSSATKNAKYEYEKIDSEFEAFRKKSLKKEQETMRKLQDEINKNNP